MLTGRPSPRVWLLAVALSASITLTNQMWVGEATIYSADHAAVRERLHQAIFQNRLPLGAQSWDSIGANSTNIRLMTVWAAEAIHRLTGQPIASAYKSIETAALFVACVLLFTLLTRVAGSSIAFVGLMYFGCVLPLTYVLHYFHPWDKPSLVAWIAAMLLAHRRQWLLVGVVLAVGMFVKYDIMIFPLLVASAEWARSHRRSALLPALALALVTSSTYVFLQWLAPGGVEARDPVSLMVHNLHVLRDFAFRYPPFLGLMIPTALALHGYRNADSFARAAFHLAAAMGLVLLVQTNFVEFRAEMPLLVLQMPAAAFGVRRLLGPESAVTSAPKIVAPPSARSSACQ